MYSKMVFRSVSRHTAFCSFFVVFHFNCVGEFDSCGAVRALDDEYTDERRRGVRLHGSTLNGRFVPQSLRSWYTRDRRNN